MKYIFNTTLILSCFFGINMSHAHALFVKTASTATPGNSHVVSIFYAEAEEGKKENIEDWWSNTTDFELWLTMPDGSKKQLEVQPNGDHFLANFTPKEKGLYQLTINHNVAEIFDRTQYQFNASAYVYAGNRVAKIAKDQTKGFHFINLNPTDQNSIKLKVYDGDKTVADVPVTIYSSNGSKETLNSNEQGEVEFTPQTEGEYLVETYKIDTAEEADFDKQSRIATLIVNTTKE